MHLHEIIRIKGCITQEIYIKGKTLPELERILGFQKGRLESGVAVAALIQLPSVHQFEFLGYSQVAAHKHNSGALDGFNVTKLKETILKDTFTLVGIKRLVRVIANKLHDDRLDFDLQYPPGLGVPQWKITDPLRARIVGVVMPGEVYK